MLLLQSDERFFNQAVLLIIVLFVALFLFCFFLAMNFEENHFSPAKSNQWLPLLVLFLSSQRAK